VDAVTSARDAYHEDRSQERLAYLEWSLLRLARIHVSGFEEGLHGEKLSTPLEGSPEVWATKRRGYAAGLRRRAERAKAAS
jgi:hypothetical protein